MSTTVLIRLEVEGFHRWPGAWPEVSFLADNHRHTFVITCAYRVTDLDREKEIFIQRDQVRKYLALKYGEPCQFGAMSCEHIATDIIGAGAPEGMAWCEVWEEQTGGARVER